MPRGSRFVTLVALAGALALAPITTPSASAALPPIALTPVATGLNQPVFATHDGTTNGVLHLVEQPGVIKALAAGSTTPTTFLDLTDRVLAGGERGLLGLAFHPAKDGRFYVHYTRPPDGAVVVSEFTGPVPGSERVLLTIPKAYANHNGGMVAFGADGHLYIGVGDGGSGNDPDNNAQNPGQLLGKILRISPTPGTGGLPYSIPADNPFVGVAGARPEIYAVGFRNPWRFSFDRGSGWLIVGDVGQGGKEEIDLVARGGNYGWRVYEGTTCTGLGPAPCDPAPYTPPVLEYGTHQSGRCAVTGGYVFRGSGPELPNPTYVYGDFCSGEIFAVAGGVSQLLLDTDLNISSFGEDASGAILVVDLNGSVFRITPGTPGTTTPPQACTPPIGPISGPMWQTGVSLGALGESLRALAVQICLNGS